MAENRVLTVVGDVWQAAPSTAERPPKALRIVAADLGMAVPLAIIDPAGRVKKATKLPDGMNNA